MKPGQLPRVCRNETRERRLGRSLRAQDPAQTSARSQVGAGGRVPRSRGSSVGSDSEPGQKTSFLLKWSEGQLCGSSRAARGPRPQQSF